MAEIIDINVLRFFGGFMLVVIAVTASGVMHWVWSQARRARLYVLDYEHHLKATGVIHRKGGDRG